LWFPKDGNQGYKGGGDVNEQLKWNEDNQLEVEDDKQPKVDSHLISPIRTILQQGIKIK
jgi:hypothetical protein